MLTGYSGFYSIQYTYKRASIAHAKSFSKIAFDEHIHNTHKIYICEQKKNEKAFMLIIVDRVNCFTV